ncbi:MAG: hypothetical protein PHR68_00280 [Candidatus Gracilibacteria bacterium]|nr:hypothetical protein [Candidatus Gracilibacteria bacterium]
MEILKNNWAIEFKKTLDSHIENYYKKEISKFPETSKYSELNKENLIRKMLDDIKLFFKLKLKDLEAEKISDDEKNQKIKEIEKLKAYANYIIPNYIEQKFFENKKESSIKNFFKKIFSLI